MRQIRRLIELIKRIFRRKKDDEESIILDLKLPNIDEASSDKFIGEKSEYKPLNYPLECSVNLKINKKNKERILNNRCCPLNRWVNIKKAGGLKYGRSK